MRKLQYSQFPPQLSKSFVDSCNMKIEQAQGILSSLGDRIDVKPETMPIVIVPIDKITIKTDKSYSMGRLYVLCFSFVPTENITIGSTYTTIATFSNRAKYNEVFKTNSMNGIILKDTNEIKLSNVTLSKDNEYGIAITIICA